jgi:4-alpha-glucanotransferase
MTQELSTGYLNCRCAGVLLHITSLPGPAKSGDLGPDAYRFVDFLQEAGVHVWQMLPIGPTQADGSPYQTSSVHGGNARLISIESLEAEGWIPGKLQGKEQITDAEKAGILRRVWREFQTHASPRKRTEL